MYPYSMFDIQKKGFSSLMAKFFLAPNLSVSGSKNKHRKKLRKDNSAEMKKGALTLISPINPPIIGPSIKPNPKAAPIIAKFFFLSAAFVLSAK